MCFFSPHLISVLSGLFLHQSLKFRTEFCFVGTQEYKNSVITFRRKCQRVAKSSLVFIDGSCSGWKMAKSTTKKAEKYEPRVDIFGAVGFNEPLACETATSTQRKRITNTRTGKQGVKG
jgi:hypothetical protein